MRADPKFFFSLFVKGQAAAPCQAGQSARKQRGIDPGLFADEHAAAAACQEDGGRRGDGECADSESDKRVWNGRSRSTTRD